MSSDRNAFTLLELVIALAIAAVIAAFALPSYRGQIAHGYRADAVAALYRAAQFVDSRFPDAAALPAGLDRAPESGTAVYRLRVLSGNDASGGYVIEARPMEDGPMRDDSCGVFTLDATGERGNQSAAGTGTPPWAECWGIR
ncbi:pilus assembly protein PilE [Burkholderia sp. WAC0059]|uniref:type IV pilin protein n=1 Tax=Burkholderia sp. WAC0059 TaxID=2066022 RepID=UPI000C7F0A21|nr:type IV pilin protein [Burkholderia sp. WAC0059]PLZ00177.1 pilus assembly protein PilE [Burkholderia sp. WAC0059]